MSHCHLLIIQFCVFFFDGGVSDDSFSLTATHWKLGFSQSASLSCDNSSLTDCFKSSVRNFKLLKRESKAAANTSGESSSITSELHLLMMDSLTAVLNAMILAESPYSLSMLLNTLCIIGKMQDIGTLLSVQKKMVATSSGSSNS